MLHEFRRLKGGYVPKCGYRVSAAHTQSQERCSATVQDRQHATVRLMRGSEVTGSMTKDLGGR
eukprot:842748-Pyramimonas_sp.AAC.1